MRTAIVIVIAGLMTGCAGSATTDYSASDSEQIKMAAPRSGSNRYGAYLAASQARVSHDFDQASDLFRSVLQVQPGQVPVLSKAFLNAIEAGNRDDAERLAANLADQSDNAYVSRLVLAIKAIREKKFDQLIGPEPRPKFAQQMLFEPMVKGWAYAGAGEAEKGVSEFASVTDNGRLTSFHDYYAALVYDFDGETAKADAAFEKLRQAGEMSIRVIAAHGRFLERQGRYREAIGLYNNFLEQNGDHLVILEERQRAERKDPVPPFITSAAHGLAEAFYAFGAEMAMRDQGTAVLFLRMALFAYEDHQAARLLLARLFEVSDRQDTALAEYKKITGSSAHGLTAQLRVAEIENEKDDKAGDRPVRALRELERTAKTHAARRLVRETMGRILGQQERWDDAVEVYTSMIDALDAPTPDDWRLYFARAIAYHEAKRWPLAEADLQTALKLEPNQPEVLNYLGYSWIDQGIKLDEGRAMIEQAVEARPDAGFIIDSLGWVHYRLGNYEDAVKALERAVALEPGDPTINDHLGDALWRVGRKIEARFQWRHALGMDPDEELEKKIRHKLDRGLGEADDIPSPSAAHMGHKAAG